MNLIKERHLQKNKALKKSIIVACFFGFLLAIVMMQFSYGGGLRCIFSKEYLLISVMSSVIIFFIMILSMLRQHKCPSCSKYWTYELYKDDILDRNIREKHLHYLKLNADLIYGTEVHLEEFRCNFCDYELIKSRKKLVVELE